jgi:hypothetical protein
VFVFPLPKRTRSSAAQFEKATSFLSYQMLIYLAARSFHAGSARAARKQVNNQYTSLLAICIDEFFFSLSPSTDQPLYLCAFSKKCKAKQGFPSPRLFI